MGPIKTWNTALPGNYGTVSCVVERGARRGILSASHVLCPLWEGVSAGAHPYVRIALGDDVETEGELANWSVPVNSDGVLLPSTRDAALAMLSDAGADALLARVALPTGIAPPPSSGQQVFFIGASTGTLRSGKVLDPSTAVLMGYDMYGHGSAASRPFYISLSNTIEVDLKFGVLGGDSGCMLFDAQGRALAMLIGTFGDRPYFMPLAPALSLFDVEPVFAKADSDNSIMKLIAQAEGAINV